MIYSFDCQDIRIEKYSSVKFAAEVFPLEQNCDFLELYKIHQHNELRFFYNDGSRRVVYAPAFDTLFVDSQSQIVTIWISEDNLTYDSSKNGFSTVQIRIKNPQVFHRLTEIFALDKMITLEDWLTT
ncbi:hypothetical protein [Capnocytophaga sp.]|uniref:hypothetical protein n=1 Tax=Capnocytophaga sp. TaxID=44737 RepID=UPI0026DB6E0A|nr:hypothetical protein [Capnocytophaga sp.]MDO5105621.1 hypothetical protein [Capnocytophaga sp.]